MIPADRSTTPETAGDWYRDAVIYQIHVKSFFDGNDDGIGDFTGLLAKLDYIAALGVDTLWLLPFYPSPRRDDGYDVADYLGVHPDYGSFEDLRRFLDAAHARGLRVIGDLVLNHTSDAHAWFQRARHAPPDSPERDFYVWSDTDQRYPGTRIIFPDVEKSNWSWDAVAGRYYFHRFYAHQPDLNFDNPQVLDAVLEVLRFWLDLGLDGFRLDAVAYLVERDGSSNENLPETHAILKRLRAEIDAHYPDRVLLAEANQWPEDMQAYFGDDDECHMAFHFPLMPRMYMAVAQEDRFPITDILRQTPPTPPRSQWAIFLRNHDELTLEMVTDAERDYLWNTYAADPRARLNLGIRRRLAPLLERDRRRIELLTALLLTLPGTPVMYYGDEIGMGDNIHLGDRDGVRTPMQWSVDRNGGFSRADAQRLVLPTIMDPLYGYGSVNVEAQERDPHSLLHWTRRLLAVRRRYGGLFGRGALRFLHPRNRKVLVYLREWEGVHLLCVANLARTLQAVELDLSEFEARIPLDIVGGAALPAVGRVPYLLTLAPYGLYLFELAGRDRLPESLRAEPEPAPELATLVLRGALRDELATAHRERLESALLPDWLERRDAGYLLDASVGVRLLALLAPAADADVVMLRFCRGSGEPEWLPLAIAWDGEPDAGATGKALARVRRGSRVGHLVDGLAHRGLLDTWREAWLADTDTPGEAMRFLREGDASLRVGGTPGIEPMGHDRHRSTVLLDRTLLVSVACRGTRVLEGPLQLLRALPADAPTLPLIGTLECALDGNSEVVAYAQAWPPWHGDAATWTLDFLRRTLHDYRACPPEEGESLLRGYLPLARLLGRKLGELHRALRAVEPPAQMPLTAEGVGAAALATLARWRSRMPASGGIQVGDVATQLRRLRALSSSLSDAPALETMRIHGNPTLENVLLGVDDLCFIGFADPAPGLRAGDSRQGARLSDLADLLHGLSHAAATTLLEGGEGDAPTLAFVQGFRRVASRALLRQYQLTWSGSRDARIGRHEQRTLRLLQAARALRDPALPLHSGTGASLWQTLRWALREPERHPPG